MDTNEAQITIIEHLDMSRYTHGRWTIVLDLTTLGHDPYDGPERRTTTLDGIEYESQAQDIAYGIEQALFTVYGASGIEIERVGAVL